MSKLSENESVTIAVALLIIACWSMMVDTSNTALAANIASGLIGYMSKV